MGVGSRTKGRRRRKKETERRKKREGSCRKKEEEEGSRKNRRKEKSKKKGKKEGESDYTMCNQQWELGKGRRDEGEGRQGGMEEGKAGERVKGRERRAVGTGE